MIKQCVGVVFLWFFLVFGLMSIINGVHSGVYNECSYNSYATKYNPFYRATCELFKPRKKLIPAKVEKPKKVIYPEPKEDYDKDDFWTMVDVRVYCKEMKTGNIIIDKSFHGVKGLYNSKLLKMVERSLLIEDKIDAKCEVEFLKEYL